MFHGCFNSQCAPRAIVISLFHMSTHNSYRDIQHNTFSTIHLAREKCNTMPAQNLNRENTLDFLAN